MYDDIAKKVGIKAIATVESNNNYSAINYNDPITVGVVQWFGDRAANILNKMKTENAPAWVGVDARLVADLASHPSNDYDYWSNRYLLRDEGRSLVPVLNANKPIQNAQIILDFEKYLAVATTAGLDKDNNTKALLFFFNIYHQSPRQAKLIIKNAGNNPSMSRLRAMVANNDVLYKYKTRYDTAYRIIDTWDYSGVDDPAGESPPLQPEDEWDDSDNEGVGLEKVGGDISWVRNHGDTLSIIYNNGAELMLIPTPGGGWIPIENQNVGEVVPPPAEVTPDPPDPGDPDPPSDYQEAVVKWMTDRVGRYNYSQGVGRTNPDVSGYSDCSAIVSYAYLKATGKGIHGGNTVGQLRYGKGVKVTDGSGAINLSLLQKGDLIYIGWPGGRPLSQGGVDHVEMYMGGGKCIGHGSGRGPKIKTLNTYVARATRWFVRRFPR